MDYYLIAPFEILTDKEFSERKNELIKHNRKILAVVFDCKDIKDFERKYFHQT